MIQLRNSRLLVLTLSLLLGWSAGAGASELPAKADLRPVLKTWDLGPRRQGSRPTCSVFTFTGGLEFALGKARKKGARLSVDYVNWAANQERKQARDGGFFSDMWKGFARHGVCAEDEMPYGRKFDAERNPDEKAAASAGETMALGLSEHWLKKWNPKTGLSADEFASIKQTLNSGWPVCGGFRWPKEAAWKDGVLQTCGAEDVFDGHSVLLVGYHDDPAQPGGGVFLIRDSGSGEDRAMPYGYAQSFMNDALWIGLAE
ncbi:C1 family peptidase [Haloferula sp. BvORR071]|uniref:C1 family peptidase n=1 Tax=Haloferula sp. BvORR071 TaxID=1396141 RepID=UPI0005538178|nr:C1 family peptidase [Haloferula sp. BvORR071]